MCLHFGLKKFCFRCLRGLPVRRMEEGECQVSVKSCTETLMLSWESLSNFTFEHPWGHFGCHTGIHFCFWTLAFLPQPLIYCLPEPSRPPGFPPFQDSSSARQLPASGCLTGLNIPAVEWNLIAGTQKSSHKHSQNQITTKVRLANCYVTSLQGLEAPSKLSPCIHRHSMHDINVSLVFEQTCDATRQPWATYPNIRAEIQNYWHHWVKLAKGEAAEGQDGEYILKLSCWRDWSRPGELQAQYNEFQNISGQPAPTPLNVTYFPIFGSTEQRLGAGSFIPSEPGPPIYVPITKHLISMLLWDIIK